MIVFIVEKRKISVAHFPKTNLNIIGDKWYLNWLNTSISICRYNIIRIESKLKISLDSNFDLVKNKNKRLSNSGTQLRIKKCVISEENI